jgi:hypothetical protein
MPDRTMLRRVTGLTAAVAIALAFVVILVNASARGPGVASAPSPSSTSLAPQPTPSSSSPTTPQPTRADAWTQLRWSAPSTIPDRAGFLDLVSWRDGYVAAADVGGSDGHLGATYTSADGVHWQRGATFSANPTIVATDTRLVAVVNRLGLSPSVEAWASFDGRNWQRDESLALSGANHHEARRTRRDDRRSRDRRARRLEGLVFGRRGAVESGRGAVAALDRAQRGGRARRIRRARS